MYPANAPLAAGPLAALGSPLQGKYYLESTMWLSLGYLYSGVGFLHFLSLPALQLEFNLHPLPIKLKYHLSELVLYRYVYLQRCLIRSLNRSKALRFLLPPPPYRPSCD